MHKRTRGAVRVVFVGVMATGSVALAQAHGHTHTTADAGHARDDSEPSFGAAQTVTAQDVGTGGAPTTANGPVGELRGSTPDATETITGPIGPGDVARLVQSQMGRIRECYERALQTHPHLAGRIELRFTIGADGHVTQSQAYGMPEAPDVAPCIADYLRRTTFPRPANGPLPFIYPVSFAPPPPATHARHATHPAHH